MGCGRDVWSSELHSLKRLAVDVDMESQEKTTERKSVYFFWDYDLTDEDVREILRGANETEKIWVMSRILQSARWDDIWKFLTLKDVQAYFDKIQWRTPYLKDLWKYALEVWSRA